MSRPSRSKPSPLAVGPRTGPLPLSYAQERLWYLDQLESGAGTRYQVARAIRIRGELDLRAFKEALTAIVRRHESLRTCIVTVDGTPEQRIAPDAAVELPMIESYDLSEDNRVGTLARLAHEQLAKPMLLDRGPLIRPLLARFASDDQGLVVTWHHIVYDAWSERIYFRELFALYDAFRIGAADPLPPLAVHYADFARWQRDAANAARLADGLAYWRTQLADAPDSLALPLARPRPTMETRGADVYTQVIGPSTLLELKQVGRQAGTTLFMTLLAGFAALLSRYSGQSDMVIGSPVANRTHAHLERLIGFFLNSLALRLCVRPDMAFRELLHAVRDCTLDAYEYQDVPFPLITEQLAGGRHQNKPPLFQVVFSLQNVRWSAPVVPGLTFERVPLPAIKHARWGTPTDVGVESIRSRTLHVRFDLEVHAWEERGELMVAWVYSRDIFDRPRIEQMARHYAHIVEAIATDVAVAIGDVALYDVAERQQLIDAGNDTARPLPADTIVASIEKQAAERPDAIAISVDGRAVTFGALNRHSDELARALVARGAGAETIVGVFIERSVEQLIGILAVLKAGAVCLPVDPAWPRTQIADVLADARPADMVTTSATAERLPRDIRSIDWRAGGFAGLSTLDSTRTPSLKMDQAAVIVYTAATTGPAKPVVLTHRGIMASCHAVGTYFDHVSGDRHLATAISFDVSIADLLSPLSVGSQVVMGGADGIARAVREIDPHSMIQTPRQLAILAAEHPSTLAGRRILVCGEPLPLELAQRASRSSTCHFYGLTEATPWTIGQCLSPASLAPTLAGTLPIGLPAANCRAYVMDTRLRPVPLGMSGDLYIAGLSLARGYLRRPGLTAETFVADPHGPPGSRMVRTGDLARRGANGLLEFLGRGHAKTIVEHKPVNLNEITAALLAQVGVADAVTVLDAASRIISYVVAVSGVTLDPGSVRRRLLGQLPAYAAPATIIPLDAWPLKRDGRLDTAALPHKMATLSAHIEHRHHAAR